METNTAIRTRTRVAMPFLLTVGMGLASITAFLSGVLTVWPLVAAIIGGGYFGINGREVTPFEFFVIVGPYALPICIVCVAIVAGLWNEKAWVRKVVPLSWAVLLLFGLWVALGPARHGFGFQLAGLAAVFLFGSGTYFAYKPSVIAYYEEIERRRSPERAQSSTGAEGHAV